MHSGGGFGFDRVGDADHAHGQAIRADRHGGLPCGGEALHFGQIARPGEAAQCHCVAIHARFHALPRHGEEAGRLLQGDRQPLRMRDDRPTQRMLGVALGRGRQAQHLGLRMPVHRYHIRHPRLAGRDRAGLIQDDGVDAAGGLQRLAALDQDAAFGAAPGRHHDRGGCGQAQRAGAGDDQHGHEIHHRERKRSKCYPHQERHRGDGQYAHGEIAADHIRQPRHGRARTLRLPYQLDHLLQDGGPPYLARLKPQASGTIDRAAINPVAGLLIHRHAFAREHGFVDGRGAFADRAIHRDLLAGADHYQVAHQHLLDRNIPLGAIAQHARGLGLQLAQMPDGFRGLSAGARLQHPAEQNQGDDHGGGFVINLMSAAQRHCQ